MDLFKSAPLIKTLDFGLDSGPIELNTPLYPYYKILRKDRVHHGFKHTLGEFRYCSTGVYFCHLEDIPRWLSIYDDADTIVEVKIPIKATVISLRNKLKTDWFYLEGPTPIATFLKSFFNLLTVLKQDPFLIRYIPSPRYELQFYAISCNPHTLGCIDRQLHEAVLEALKKNGLALRHVRIQTSEACLTAVKQNGNALGYVTEDICTRRYYRREYEEICAAAVRQTGLALQFVREQTPDLCLTAVEQNGYALQYVKEKSAKICLTAIYQNSRATQFVPPEIAAHLRKRSIRVHWEVNPFQIDIPVSKIDERGRYNHL